MVSLGASSQGESTHLEMHGEHWWNSLDAQLLCRVLRLVAVPTCVLGGTQLFLCCEPLQAVSQVQHFVAFVVVQLPFFVIPYVETQVHVRILRGCDITTAVAGDCARELAIECLVDHTFAVVGIGVGRAAVGEV